MQDTNVKTDVVDKKKIEDQQKTETTISICNIMKDNTSKVIRKIESTVPPNVELYSDLYIQYLHSLDDIFGACYTWQKSYLDKFGVDSKVLDALNDYCNILTDRVIGQIDISSGLQKAYVQTRVTGIKLSDQYLHLVMDYYTKMLSQFTMH